MKTVLLVIPRYQTYGSEGHYVMPMGILYVSAYLKQSGVAKVKTLNLNHQNGDEKQVITDVIIGEILILSVSEDFQVNIEILPGLRVLSGR